MKNGGGTEGGARRLRLADKPLYIYTVGGDWSFVNPVQFTERDLP